MLMIDNFYYFGVGKYGVRVIISEKESVVV